MLILNKTVEAAENDFCTLVCFMEIVADIFLISTLLSCEFKQNIFNNITETRNG